jgi:hypothetical protein
LAPNFINVAAWLVTDAPAFRLGKIVTMAMLIAMVLMACLATFLEQKKIMLPKTPQRVVDEEMVNNRNTDKKPDEADDF